MHTSVFHLFSFFEFRILRLSLAPSYRWRQDLVFSLDLLSIHKPSLPSAVSSFWRVHPQCLLSNTFDLNTTTVAPKFFVPKLIPFFLFLYFFFLSKRSDNGREMPCRLSQNRDKDAKSKKNQDVLVTTFANGLWVQCATLQWRAGKRRKH